MATPARARTHTPRTGTTPRAPALAVALAVLTIAGTLAIVASETARADSITVMSAAFPTGRWGTSAVWTGTHAYIFGGYDGSRLDQIVRYTPTTDSITVMSTTLPSRRAYTTAVWTGTHAYIFGGSTNGGSLDQIVRYDPQTDTTTIMGSTLPTGRDQISAVWTGTHAYLFGGGDGGNQIVRYDPQADTTTNMSAILPTAKCCTSAVWTGTYAYVFGGVSFGSYEIVRYDPQTDTTTVMSASLPTGRAGTSAVWTGTHAYIFGGYDGSNLYEIVRYDPQTDSTTIMSASLPTARRETSAVWTGTHAYVFGGCMAPCGDVYESRSPEIVRYSLEPGAAQGLTDSRGPGVGEITLEWQPPLGNTYSPPLTGYRVYRSSSSWGSYTLIDTTPAGTLTYTDTGLPNSATRYYRVSAVDDVGEGPQSNTASATTFSVPSAPRNLQASPGPAAGEITLNWQAPFNDGGLPLTSYRVYRSETSEGPYVQVGEAQANVLTFTDTGLPASATRHYRVSAENDAGEGPRGSTSSATTFDPPSPPQSLAAARGLELGEITLTWNPPTSDGGTPVTSYNVYRSSTSWGTYTLIATLGNVLTYTDTGLPNGATRYYRVTAVNDADEGPQSNTASATTISPPSLPQSLTAATGPGVGEITLEWQPPTNDGGRPVTGYKVYRSATQWGSYTLIATLGNTLTHTDAGLPNAATRWYRVSALNDAGEGPKSSKASATTFPPPRPPQSNTATTGPVAGEITLDWNPPASDGGLPVTGYKVYRADASGGPYALIATPGNVLTYKDAGLPSNTTRYYRVSALNDAGEGPQSGTASATTFPPPSPPRNPTAARGPGTGEITIDWSPPANNGGLAVTGYRIYRGTASGEETLLAQVDNVLTHKDTGLCDGLTYHYRVTALNPVGEGPRSNAASAMGCEPPSAPQDLDATLGPGVGEITLEWQPPLDDGGVVANYIIYRAETSAGPYEPVATVPGENRSFTDAHRFVGTPYHYRVSALNVAGEGPWSGEAMTVGSAPPKLQDNPDGTCTVYSDEDDDDLADEGEAIQTQPCPKPGTRTNPGNSATVYDDKNDDGQVGEGEETATTPPANPKVQQHPDGSASIYNDKGDNDTMDEGEETVRTPGRASPPQNPTATRRNDHVHVEWDPPANTGGSPVAGYVVERREAGTTPWDPLTPGFTPNTGYQDYTAVRSQDYEYRVAAVNTVGPGEWTEPVSAYTPSPHVEILKPQGGKAFADGLVVDGRSGGCAAQTMDVSLPYCDLAVVKGNVNVTVHASSPHGITKVTFLVDGAPKAVRTTPTQGSLYTWEWNTNAPWVENLQEHDLTVKAVDGLGAARSESVRVFTANRNQQTALDVNASAYADGHTVQTTRSFRADGSEPGNSHLPRIEDHDRPETNHCAYTRVQVEILGEIHAPSAGPACAPEALWGLNVTLYADGVHLVIDTSKAHAGATWDSLVTGQVPEALAAYYDPALAGCSGVAIQWDNTNLAPPPECTYPGVTALNLTLVLDGYRTRITYSGIPTPNQLLSPPLPTVEPPILDEEKAGCIGLTLTLTPPQGPARTVSEERCVDNRVAETEATLILDGGLITLTGHQVPHPANLHQPDPVTTSTGYDPALVGCVGARITVALPDAGASETRSVVICHPGEWLEGRWHAGVLLSGWWYNLTLDRGQITGWNPDEPTRLPTLTPPTPTLNSQEDWNHPNCYGAKLEGPSPVGSWSVGPTGPLCQGGGV